MLTLPVTAYPNQFMRFLPSYIGLAGCLDFFITERSRDTYTYILLCLYIHRDRGIDIYTLTG
jgi:hypothetical protein